MKRIILLLTTLSLINGHRKHCIQDEPQSLLPTSNSNLIFDLKHFIETTRIEIGPVAEVVDPSENSKIRIYKNTHLVFPTTEVFSGSLTSNFIIETSFWINNEPDCTWNLISLTDCNKKIIFRVSLDPEKKLVIVTFVDRNGQYVHLIFVECIIDATCLRKLLINVEDDKVSVFLDNEQLRYYNGEAFGRANNVDTIDISDSETNLLRLVDDRASVEMDVESFVIISLKPSRMYPQQRPAFIPYPNKIIGPQGPRGSPGVKGEKGTRGFDGCDGKDGAKGDRCESIYFPVKGVKGSDGEKGCNGEDGTPGSNGSNGSNGWKGEAGNDGSPGRNGEKGSDGCPGSSGEKGCKGDRGLKGEQGSISDEHLKQRIKELVRDGFEAAGYF